MIFFLTYISRFTNRELSCKQELEVKDLRDDLELSMSTKLQGCLKERFSTLVDIFDQKLYDMNAKFEDALKQKE